MRNSLIFLIALFSTFSVFAQIQDPVKWSFEVVALEENEVDLVITASIEEGWHMYAQDVEGGPIPTSFTFFEQQKIELKGAVVAQREKVLYLSQTKKLLNL